MSFDHTTWIDRQREAGAARGNVFADILAEADRRRKQSPAAGIERERASRRHADRMRGLAAEYDRQVEAESNRGVC